LDTCVWGYAGRSKVKNKMRISDIPPDKLCCNHLLDEHNELHAMENILVKQGMGSVCESS